MISSLRAMRSSTISPVPFGDDAVQLFHAIGQRRRSGLQDVGGLDLEQLPVLHRIHTFPATPRLDLLGPELPAAPRANDDVGIAPRDLGAIADDAILAQRLRRQLGKTI